MALPSEIDSDRAHRPIELSFWVHQQIERDNTPGRNEFRDKVNQMASARGHTFHRLPIDQNFPIQHIGTFTGKARVDLGKIDEFDSSHNVVKADLDLLDVL